MAIIPYVQPDRVVASGGAVVPGTPFEIGAPLAISLLAPRLLHTSNTVFKKCGPPSEKPSLFQISHACT